jgi:hypothetical protein
MSTNREQLKEEIARLINHGLNNQEIAEIIYTPHIPHAQELSIDIIRDYMSKPVA